MALGRKKRWILGGIAIFGALVAGAPCIAFMTVLAIPGMAQEKFISSADGSTGPALTLCLWVWGGVTVFGLITGSVPIVVGALRRDE